MSATCPKCMSLWKRIEGSPHLDRVEVREVYRDRVALADLLRLGGRGAPSYAYGDPPARRVVTGVAQVTAMLARHGIVG